MNSLTRVIDLSVPISHGMPRYPSAYLPDVSLVDAASHEKERRAAQILTIGTHAATHIDAPYHADPDGPAIDKISPRTFIGPAAVLRLGERDRRSPIGIDDLQTWDGWSRYCRVLFDTGWSRQTWGKKEYFTQGPFLSKDAARWLVDQNDLALLGMDFPNVDSIEDMAMGTRAPNHYTLLHAGILLLENLIRLEELDDAFLLACPPLGLVGGDAGHCRALAVTPLHGLSQWT